MAVNRASRQRLTRNFLRARRVTLLRRDALEVLGELPAASFDMIFADPPYLLSNGGTTMQAGKRARVDKGAWDRSRGDVETDHLWHRAWLRGCQRVLKPSGTIWVCGNYASICSVGWAMQSLGFHFLNVVTWEKQNPPSNLGCRTLTYSTEFLIWAAPQRYKPLRHAFNYEELKAECDGRQMRDVWVFSPPPPSERRHGKHPTQKPEALLDRCLKVSAREGDLVLDPFCGSATTGVAALRRGCRFVGVEADGSYLEIARKRLRDFEGRRRRRTAFLSVEALKELAR